MKTKLLFTIISITVAFSACKITQILPYYTEPSKLAQLKTGMCISEINAILEIEPHNLYHIQEDGSSVLVYNYRLKQRKTKYNAHDFEKGTPHSIEGQRSGTPFYTEEHIAYVLLKDGKLQSLITDKGREDSQAIVVRNNLLKLISEEELIEYEKRLNLWDEKDGEKNIQFIEDKNKNEIVIPLDGKKKGVVKGINVDVE